VTNGFVILEDLSGVKQADMVIIDTDILIDAGRCGDEALNCLQQIEDKFSAAVSSKHNRINYYKICL
jgi:hypothetical protein